MPAFIVRPIAPDIAASVRSTLRAPGYGHPAHHERAQGTGPCRACLSEFVVGRDDRILFTYNPFVDAGAVPQPGPVFIHAGACEPFAGGGYPRGLAGLPVVAEAHLGDGTRSSLQALVPGSAAETLTELLADPNVRFVHLRHAEAGCFIARVDRVADPDSM